MYLNLVVQTLKLYRHLDPDTLFSNISEVLEILEIHHCSGFPTPNNGE